MNLTLHREKPTHTALPGLLYESTGKICYTLERHPDDPEHKPIPAGTYPVTLYPSPRFETLVPLLHDVPGRTMIEIHYGNFTRDTEGCILVGKGRDKDAVTYSRLALKELVEKMALDNGPHSITVIESV